MTTAANDAPRSLETFHLPPGARFEPCDEAFETDLHIAPLSAGELVPCGAGSSCDLEGL
jgi:hypothetical protein